MVSTHDTNNLTVRSTRSNDQEVAPANSSNRTETLGPQNTRTDPSTIPATEMDYSEPNSVSYGHETNSLPSVTQSTESAQVVDQPIQTSLDDTDMPEVSTSKRLRDDSPLRAPSSWEDEQSLPTDLVDPTMELDTPVGRPSKFQALDGHISESDKEITDLSFTQSAPLDSFATTNPYELLHEPDLEYSTTDFYVPNIFLHKSSDPRPEPLRLANKTIKLTVKKAMKLFKEKYDALETAGSYHRFTDVLANDPTAVAIILPRTSDDKLTSSIIQPMASTRAVHRFFCKSGSTQLPSIKNLNAKYSTTFKLATTPTKVFSTLVDDKTSRDLLRSLAVWDLFLENRAHELYYNPQKLTNLTGSPPTRWPAMKMLTD
ncbi:hypothetical protein DAPPUDRAFT_342763 [Daphnia pulex]|uniref:Uncharacterized protein n=1 Tax=Daphnia pulex TaxID=6669 RepID=E9I637_DAPPU|nr:hypothetical protein DAPPUDRAFT_342763 [Daphnia pulex]|eukprot:EFX60543.1 hypothetical protein DAPPUDRAFT_342763 [Daphnia pulex]